jgi:threonine dehydratase
MPKIPNQPRGVPNSLGPTLGEIYEARRRIRGVVRHTPLERSPSLSEVAGHDVYMKLEAWQRTRSFKMRGAYNAVSSLDPEHRARGLVTASAGNHGQAVALAAREVGARATIFIPSNAPEIKKHRIQSFGATINADSATYDDAEVAALRFAEDTGATFVHSYSDRAVVAGQGTVGLEIIEDMPHVKNVIVPVGGGGLIAGVGVAIKSANQDIKVLGVQSTHTPAMYEAFKAGKLVTCPIPPTIADGLAGQTDELSYQRALGVVDEMYLVDESSIPSAIRNLYYDGVLAEGSAAVSAAAISEGVIKIDGPTVVVITGGNIDAAQFAAILTSESQWH